ncbi:replication-relaxation family protein [Armatimonas sp.]|uniref:replication-relaxation family protein n=1 Tax=Armatimonas sp. TaxID=1872638 RepID=UPI0037524C82
MPKKQEEQQEEGSDRRRRYEPGVPKRSMTPLKLRILSYIAECGILSTGQVARIAQMKEEAVTKHLRHLFDLRMVDTIAVPYANLAPPEENGPNLAFGPGQNIYIPTRAAIQFLERARRISDEAAARKLPDYGPRNALFLSHELLVRDVRIWLELCNHIQGGFVERWLDGPAAHLPPVRPDAWFVYRIKSVGSLVGFVEADRGTERGDQWEKKAGEYAELLESDVVAEATGGRKKARVLVITLTARRRDRLAQELARSPIKESAYVATVEDLKQGGLEHPVWRYSGMVNLQPLLATSVLSSGQEQDVNQAQDVKAVD